MTRAGYHAWKRRPPSARARENEHLKARITEIYAASRGIYGAPRVHAELRAVDGIGVSRKRVARLMRELDLEGVSRRGKRRARRSAAEAPAAPDLVRRRFTASKLDELWVADITYVPIWEGWLFRAAAHSLDDVGRTFGYDVARSRERTQIASSGSDSSPAASASMMPTTSSSGASIL